MSNSIRSLLSSFLEVLSDLRFFEIRSSISTEQIHISTLLNTFSRI